MINVTKNDISIIMANANYGVCYEPIIAIDDMQIIGYEALSRFKLKNTLVSPDIVFKALHDDFGKPNSIFFHSLLETAQYIKLDIHFLRSIKIDQHYVEFLKGIISYTKAKNKYTILEGVETDEDLAIAKLLEVDYVQGYLFKKQFVTKWL